jgi:Flp pilus assembly protein TadG
MRNRFVFGKCQSQRGQTLVEFAMVLMILLLIILGTVDFARLFFTWASMANAAREGARFGTVHPDQWTSADAADPYNIEARTRALLATLGTSTPSVEIDCYAAHGQAEGEGRDYCTGGNQMHVVVEAEFQAWTPFIPPLHLEANATMVIE